MSDFDPGIEIEMVAGTPSPGIPSAITDTCTIITSTTAIATIDHAHTRTPAPRISTSASLVQSQTDPASRSLSPTSSHPPPPPATHESVKMLFDVTAFTSQNIETHLKSLSQYIAHYKKYGPKDTYFISTLDHILDIIIPSLRKVANSPNCSEHDADRTLTHFHRFSLIAFTHLLAIPTATIINTLQEVITLMFTIGQYDQRNREVILRSRVIPAIFHHFPVQALDHLFSSLSSLSISNSDHVLVVVYMLSGLGQFSQLFSPKQCDIVLQWITAALSLKLHQDANHAVRIGECLFWVSRQRFITDNSSNRVIRLQQFREFIGQLLPRSAEMPAILSFYVDLAKLNFDYASILLEQVFVELDCGITCWERYKAMETKLDVIGDLVKLIVASTRFDKHILLTRLQRILESDAVPFVVPTGEFKHNNTVYKIWTPVKVPGVDNYELILRKSAQLLANPLRDYTEEVSEFVSKKEHISDVHHCIYGFAKDHNDYEVPVPVQLIPRAINAICNPDITPAAKEVVSQFLDSNLRNLSLEPIAGASMNLDVESVTSRLGISSILKYNLSSALSDNIITAINHILETRRDISMEARMNARSLLESLDQLGEALARAYHHQHPPVETPPVPHLNYAFMKYCVHECTNQVREHYGTGADNDVDLADDEDEDMEMDEDGDDDNNDATVRDDILDHSLFTRAIRIDQLLSSAPVVPAYVSNLFQHLLMYYSDTLLSNRNLCQMVLEFRPDIWVSSRPQYTWPIQEPFFMLMTCLSIQVRRCLSDPDEYFLSWSNLLASVCADSVTNGVYELMRDNKSVNVGRGQDAQFYFNVRRYAIMFESHDFAGDVAMASKPKEAVENLRELAAAIDNSGIFGRGGGWDEIDPARLPAHWGNEANLVKLRVAMAMRFCTTLDYAFQNL
ncbi:hypothetical protein GQ42DRAFT_169938 [Ramicandelaber brevisporus]|nr:hypothetical protein GQ42DRAFT_169938 [Ramicandelaber brevisporus]